MSRAFKQIPIGMLMDRREAIFVAVKTGRLSAVITENGEVHAFMVPLAQMEEVLAHEDNHALKPEAIAQTAFINNPWNAFQRLKQNQVIEVAFRGRPRFGLISPKLQNYLSLPLSGL